MPMSTILPRSFYSRATATVARELLGMALVRRVRGRQWTGLISETEAYTGAQDSASHAYRGPTPRNRPMFGPAGVAYVYFVYGMHHMLNVVTEKKDLAGAVLIRALYQSTNPSGAGARSAGPLDGPAKLCRALQIDRRLNNWDLTRGSRLWLEKRDRIPEDFIRRKPRVGISYATEADRRAPWRFQIDPSWWKRE